MINVLMCLRSWHIAKSTLERKIITGLKKSSIKRTTYKTLSMWVYVCTYMLGEEGEKKGRGREWIHVCAHEARSWCLGVFLSLSVLYFWRQGISKNNLELTALTEWPGQWALRVLLSLPPQIWSYRCVLLYPAFSLNAGYPNSGAHIFNGKH